jgi:hypothetical protein
VIHPSGQQEGGDGVLGPLFAREWRALPRRPGHHFVRSAFLTLLTVIGLTAWLALHGGQRVVLLGNVARFGAFVFELYASWVLLPLVIFLGGMTAASAVALEKARRTFVLLLITDLRDHEIVLGKLAGSLLQLGLLGLGTTPLLASLILLGGVAPGQVVLVLLVLAAAGLAAGSAGNLVALWREQTFPALALTVLVLVLYLVGVQFLAPAIPAECQPWLDPFQALAGALHGHGPAVLGFGVAMLLLTVALNGLAVWRLRAWNPAVETVRPRQPESAPTPPRPVWANPILWREIRTLAYGRRTLLTKLLYFVAIGLVLAYAWPLVLGPRRPPFAAAFGLVPVTILSLLLISAQSVTAITAERDLRALDLLLATDLTPGEFVFGKLGGILFNVKEYVLPPLLLAGAYGWYGSLAPGGNALAAWCCVICILVLTAFVMMLGVHVGLRGENTWLATSQTLGTVFFLSAGTLICIYLILMAGAFGAQWTSFLLFIAAGVGGLLWVLNGDRPSGALTLASFLCPLAMFYAVVYTIVGRPGAAAAASPILPTAALVIVFGFTIAAMLVPLLSEFDVALGRTGGNE